MLKSRGVWINHRTNIWKHIQPIKADRRIITEMKHFLYSVCCLLMWFFTLSVNAWIVALIAFFSTAFSTFPTSQSKVAHLGRLTCGRFIQESTRVKHFKHGIHRFMWIFDRFTRAANFLENSHFLFAAIPLTPLHVKCSPIEISPRALQFLASVPNIQIYCTAPSTEQRNTTWENCWME